jgi:hypothetical protein
MYKRFIILGTGIVTMLISLCFRVFTREITEPEQYSFTDFTATEYWANQQALADISTCFLMFGLILIAGSLFHWMCTPGDRLEK